MSNARYSGSKGNSSLVAKKELDKYVPERITQAYLDGLVNGILGSKVTVESLGASTAELATRTELDNRKSGTLRVDGVDQALGPVRLVDGKVPLSRLPSNQHSGFRWVGKCPAWPVTVLPARFEDNPQLLATWTLPDVGYDYYPYFAGFAISTSAAPFELHVKANSPVGPTYSRAISNEGQSGAVATFAPHTSTLPIRGGTFYVLGGAKLRDSTSGVDSIGRLNCFAIAV